MQSDPRRKPCPECGTPIRQKSKRCFRCHSKAQRFVADAAAGATDECVPWPFCRGQKGYGRVGNGGHRIELAHRRVYELAHGSIPEGQWVLHRCDNPPCINPRHLFLGDRQANVDDMVAKGREARGERSGSAKLTANDVRDIRRLRAEGATYRALGSLYGVNGLGTIRPLIEGRTWRHVV